MATDLENLKTRRNAVTAELSAISTVTAGGLPNTGGQGTTIDHQGYKAKLYAELRELNEAIAAAESDPDQGGDGVFILTSRGD